MGSSLFSDGLLRGAITIDSDGMAEPHSTQDLWTHSCDTFPLKRSAVTRICKTKGASSGLLEYLVEFSIAPLISTINLSFGITPEDHKSQDGSCSSTWIPAPILDRCLPRLVDDHQQTSHKLHTPTGASSSSDSEHVRISFPGVYLFLSAIHYLDFRYASSFALVISLNNKSSICFFKREFYHVGL